MQMGFRIQIHCNISLFITYKSLYFGSSNPWWSEFKISQVSKDKKATREIL